MIGLIEEVKKIRTKKGEQMAFVQLQDEFGTVSTTFFHKPSVGPRPAGRGGNVMD